MATKCKFRGDGGILSDVLKLDGSLSQIIDFQVTNFEVHEKTGRESFDFVAASVKCWGSLAQNARFEAPPCLVCILWFSSAFAAYMGETAELVMFAGFKTGCNVVWRGRRRRDVCKCRKSFCVTGTILLLGFHELSCTCRGRRSALETSMFMSRGERSTLDVSCCVPFANRIVRAASSGDNVQIA